MRDFPYLCGLWRPRGSRRGRLGCRRRTEGRCERASPAARRPALVRLNAKGAERQIEWKGQRRGVGRDGADRAGDRRRVRRGGRGGATIGGKVVSRGHGSRHDRGARVRNRTIAIVMVVSRGLLRGHLAAATGRSGAVRRVAGGIVRRVGLAAARLERGYDLADVGSGSDPPAAAHVQAPTGHSPAAVDTASSSRTSIDDSPDRSHHPLGRPGVKANAVVCRLCAAGPAGEVGGGPAPRPDRERPGAAPATTLRAAAPTTRPPPATPRPARGRIRAAPRPPSAGPG
jgi:hypothetical protein